MKTLRITVALCLFAAALVSGCGGRPADPKKDVAAAVAKYYRGLAIGNTAGVCDALTAAGRQQLLEDVRGFGVAHRCSEAARTAWQMMQAYLPAKAVSQLQAVHTTVGRVSDDSATATVSMAAGLKPQRLQLIRERNAWRVNQANDGTQPNRSDAVLPALPGDQRPRVTGTWRVVYTILSGNERNQRTTWKIKPRCRVGACSFRGRSSIGFHFRFKFDRTVGDYTNHSVSYDDCINTATKAVVVRRGYRYEDTWNLRVSKAVISSGTNYATEMRADRNETYGPTHEAEINSCQADDDYPVVSSVRFVRVAAPQGREIKVAAADDEALVGD